MWRWEGISSRLLDLMPTLAVRGFSLWRAGLGFLSLILEFRVIFVEAMLSPGYMVLHGYFEG